jgi:hypothetical protein
MASQIARHGEAYHANDYASDGGMNGIRFAKLLPREMRF